MDGDDKKSFHDTARQVQSRLIVAKWFDLMGRSSIVVFLATAIAIAMIQMRGITTVDMALFGAVVGVWALVILFVAWAGRPDELEAIAAWDERAGRNEMFVSALSFESLVSREMGEELHLARARKRLNDDRAKLSKDVPTRFWHRTWISPLVVLLFALSGVAFVPPAIDHNVLDDEAMTRVKEAGKELTDKIDDLEDLKDLTDEEKESVEELKDALKDTSQRFKLTADKSRHEVLAQLEARAAQAEELAKSLGQGMGDLLDSKMLAELARHADTTDFANAARAQKWEHAAHESNKLGDTVEKDETPTEQKQRIKHATKEAMKAASKPDAKSMIGQHLDRAKDEFEKNDDKAAAKQFKQMANLLKKLQMRKLNAERMRRMAAQLRAAGQNIVGGHGDMRRLAQAPVGQGMRRVGQHQRGMPNPLVNPMGRRQMNPLQRLRPPGPRGQAGNPLARLQNRNRMPVPGQGRGQMPGGGRQGMGQGQRPVPRQGAGRMPGAGASGQGRVPIPGDGGFRAGTGSSSYANNKTNPLKAAGTKVVNADPSGNGDSEMRQVQGQEHREESLRKSRELALKFIAAQEEALDDEHLPITRHEQIIRYFRSLRKQIEQSDDTE